uniref:Uncharacterized protein n=1 Tax=Arundo donax TaxID=35708 RepID=A0A0A9FBQ0_ARUDO
MWRLCSVGIVRAPRPTTRTRSAPEIPSSSSQPGARREHTTDGRRRARGRRLHSTSRNSSTLHGARRRRLDHRARPDRAANARTGEPSGGCEVARARAPPPSRRARAYQTLVGEGTAAPPTLLPIPALPPTPAARGRHRSPLKSVSGEVVVVDWRWRDEQAERRGNPGILF